MKYFFYWIVFIFILLPLPAFSQAQATTDTQRAMQNYHTGRDLESRNLMSEANVFYNEALRLSNAEISRNAANRDTYTALIWTLRRLHRYAEVISWGEQALRLYPDEFRIVQTMGEAYFYLNDLSRSLTFMQRYVNSVPQGERASVAYFFIGEIYRTRGQFHHADIAYTTAVRLEPRLALWWFRLGSAREEVGDFSQAIEAYEQAIRLNPNYREANDGLVRSRRQVN